MRHSIQRLSPTEVLDVIYRHGFELNWGEPEDVLHRCIASCSSTWVGLAEGEVACIWGVIPPTLLSHQCYLWLYTTEKLKGNEFRFARHSQMVVQDILKEYPEVVGHVKAGHDRSVRWLKWLGAQLGEPEGLFIPFIIKAKSNDKDIQNRQ